ncbi:lysophospholipid acyltransferase family protein [Streptomyces flavofungini]|uniref:Acyltransferase family protein n=1 Tax=Streptomyces flavofungini TaxID=68200 RepID=A0ABS0XJ33_9ACTN|nr:lysophospholipid acyltransferase family protein [Streptomyces flavofungini]MBJ3813212.1 acyltransferase family protein [Streptomyces flavofungini]GHC90469.1 glycerol acyltransferase [Streptomyces flavofungini]
MADAKVIPFDDDRSRGSGQRPGRRRSGPRRPGDGAKVREVKAVPGRLNADVPEGAAPGAEPLDAGAAGAVGSGDADARRAGARGAGQGAAAESASVPEPRGGGGGGWDRRIAGGLSFLRRRLTGEYHVDDFGYDEELTDQVLMSLLRPLYEKYFRVEVKGIENIPADGGALIVANHSGTLPLDGLMMQVGVHDNHPHGRHLRLLAADLVFMLPVVNELARKAGHTLACAEDAEALLERGELVGVMPEGFKGIGKPFGDRYKLQRFGRGGFVSTALRTGSPIVPCSIVGAEEIYPMIGNAKTLARVLGIPYFPLTPTFPWLGPLGAVPLPTKWTIQFGEAIPTDGYPPEAAEDPMLMFNLTDQVREQIQHTLYKLLVQRRSVFF